MLLPINLSANFFGPNQIQARVHFHGFSQKPDGSPYHTDYDVGLDGQGQPTQSLERMLNSYGMPRSACQQNPQVVVMPVAYYRVDQYKNEFASDAQLEAFFSEIEKFLATFAPNHWRAGSLTVSAHSAGGDWLMKTFGKIDNAKTFEKVAGLILYDGLYSDEAADAVTRLAVKGWIPKVDVVSVYTKATANKTFAQVRAQLGIPLRASNVNIGDGKFRQDTLKAKTVLRHYYEAATPTQTTHDHWSIVKAAWELE